MESQEKAQVADLPNEAANAAAQERSSIEFPYTDLDNAIEVAKAVDAVAGGTACSNEQLAARLGIEPKGGGYRLRVSGAKTYELINYERGGRITLTDLGARIIDPQGERAARRDAFLRVPLYTRVFDEFKGRPLPQQAALERAMVSFGVGAKVADKARQVLLRSAKQGNFFELSPDRLTEPPVRGETRQEPPPVEKPAEKPGSGNGTGAGGTSRQVQLKSGGTLTVSASLDFFQLSAEDRTFVFDLIDKLEGYEKKAAKTEGEDLV